MTCIKGYTLDVSTNLCIACSANCLTCFGPSDKQCIDCKKDFVFDNGECKTLVCDIGYYIS